jgi:hypothetical protein
MTSLDTNVAGAYSSTIFRLAADVVPQPPAG